MGLIAPRLRLYMAGLVYQFENKEQMEEWIDMNLAHVSDRRIFYERLMCDSAMAAKDVCSITTPEGKEELWSILRSLKAVVNTYGKVYDPLHELFRPEEGFDRPELD